MTCSYDGSEPAAPEVDRQPFRLTRTITRVIVDQTAELIHDS
jgi:hypothetical protein